MFRGGFWQLTASVMSDSAAIMVIHKSPPRRTNDRGHDPRSTPLSTEKNRRRPSHLPSFATDCGKNGHARKGCYCERCVYTRTREADYGNRWRVENDSAYKAKRKEYLERTGNATTKRYEKTPKGYLVRSYRNMKSRVEGIQKGGSWVGKELLPKEEFYRWALASPDFHRLFAAYEESGYDRMLAPSPDRVDPGEGYTLENIRWVTHAENSLRAARRSKLSEHEVRQIRRDHEAGATITALAERFGVTYQTVRLIVRRETWKQVA